VTANLRDRNHRIAATIAPNLLIFYAPSPIL
jgi:hypothetical protein